MPDDLENLLVSLDELQREDLTQASDTELATVINLLDHWLQLAEHERAMRAEARKAQRALDLQHPLEASE